MSVTLRKEQDAKRIRPDHLPAELTGYIVLDQNASGIKAVQRVTEEQTILILQVMVSLLDMYYLVLHLAMKTYFMVGWFTVSFQSLFMTVMCDLRCPWLGRNIS